ncbi:hypothetical protein Bca52824_041392 [Brassica carinata]|uniref:Uncharacterized protein n=1 Tax=Brassica carinata TaxID=52824 RepID=A0A8X7RWI1_BRACI|nr:hypothetical protein Bca52824_041392 [Brassica carinata]
MEGPKKRRPLSGDGNDEAEIFWSDSKKHKKNNDDGFSDDETMRMHDNHCDGRDAKCSLRKDSMAAKALFLKSANIPVDVSTPIGPEIVSKPAKPTLRTAGGIQIVIGSMSQISSFAGAANKLGQYRGSQELLQQLKLITMTFADAIVGLEADLEWRLISFGTPYMNRYGASFKFPDDEVIKSPSCLYGHDYTVDFEGSCKTTGYFGYAATFHIF